MSLDCVGVIVVKEAGNKVKVTEVAGSSTVVTEKGNSVTVTGVISGGGGIGSGTVTSVDLTAGAGITVSGGPITTIGSILVINSDRGSSQNIFKNINVITSQDWDDSSFVWNVDGGIWSGGISQDAIVADNNNDTLFIESVGGISITTNPTTDTIFFDNIDKGSEQNIFKNFEVAGQSTVVADINNDTLTLVAGTNISITTNATTDTITINSTDQFGGTVTSVAMSVPTGFTVSGSPITSAGTLGLAFAAGFSLPTDAIQADWTTSYNRSLTAFDYNTSTGALTLTKQDTTTLIANVTLAPFSTTNLAEGTNLYFTDARARLALSAGTGISYVNSTGVITNSAPDQVVVLTAGTGITTSGAYPSFTITNSAPDQVVSLTGAGTTSISGAYPSFTITSNDQFVGTVTSVDLTAGTGITVSGGPVTTSGSITVSNNDRGSSQNIFKNFAVAGQSTIVADTNDDTLTVVAGTGVTITTNDATDTLTISATGSGGTVTSIGTTAPITGGTITATGTIGITQSGVATDGYLSSTDWNTFNSKEPALTKGNLTEATSSVLTITGGTGAVIGSGTTIQVSQAGASASGFLSSTDWNTFNNKQGTITLTTTGSTGAATFISNTLNIPNYADQFVGTVTSVAALTLGTTGTDLSSTVADSTTTPVITLNVPTASAANRGALSSTDWTTFNSKEPALTKGNLTEATSAVLTITGGTGAVIGTGTTIQVAQAGVSTSGFLSSTDWNTFNGKQSALTFSAPLVNTSGTVSIPAATGLVDGYLSATDFVTFNGKQDALTLTTTGTTGAATLIGATLNIPNYADQFIGTVTSVDMSVPTGFAISGNPITTSGTLAVAFASGYSLPTNASQTTWDTAYNDSITAFAYNTSTGALTLTQQDAGTLTATVTLQPFSTTDLTEGTNLYYTDTRARLALSAGTGITYDSATGVITNSAPDLTVVLTASTGITTSGTYPNFTIANSAPDQTVVLTAGTGITTSGTYPNFTITNSSPSSGGTVTDVAALTLGTTGTDLSSTVVNGTTTPVITLQVPTASAANRGALSSTDWSTFNNKQGTITLTTTGSTGAATFISNTLNIPSYTDQFVGTVTSVDLIAGTGITVSGGPITASGSITVNNNDRGSSQNIFKNINITTSQDWDDSSFVWSVDNGSWSGGINQDAIVADNNNDTLFIESVGGISITTDSATDTIYFDNIDKGSEQNIFKNFAVSGQSTIVADLNDDTLTVASGTGITLTTNASTDTLTITNSAPDQTVVLTASTGITTSGTYPNFTVTNSAPDQTVALTAGTGISVSGTYPNFTVTNSSPSSGGTVTSVAALTIGTTGTDLSSTVANGTTTPVITLQVPTASAANRGALSSTDWTTFNGKASNSFTTIAVATQNSIVADTATDTLTIVAGAGISLTTNDSTDTLTITNTAATSIACFAAYSTQNLSLTDGESSYSIEFDEQSVIDSSFYTHSTTVDPEEITVLSAGKYEISMGYVASNGSTAIATVYASVAINGFYTGGAFSFIQLNTSTVGQYIATGFNTYIYDLDANDVITSVFLPLYVFGATGVITINPTGLFVGDGSTYITIKKLS